MLQNQLTSEVDKYIQEVPERCERDVNYFDGWHVATNTPSQQQKADFVEHDEERIPELIDQDTGMNGEINAEHYTQYYDELETIPEENDENPLMTECKVPFSSNCAKVLTSIFTRFSCLFLLGLCINIYIA